MVIPATVPKMIPLAASAAPILIMFRRIITSSAPVAPAPTPPPVAPARPNTKLVKAKIRSAKGIATFKFKAIGEASRFQCALTKKGKKVRYKRCGSPRTYRNLNSSRYVFRVRAGGPGGNDKSPAKRKFKIQRRAS